MIKPEDIPESLINATFKHTESYTEAGQRRDIAAILNAAIEAGVVSPPCWVMMFNGKLQRDTNGEPTVWPSRGLDSPDGSIRYEHWKGQTE